MVAVVYGEVVGGDSTHAPLLNRLVKALRLINFLPLTVFNLSRSTARLHLFIYLYFHGYSTELGSYIYLPLRDLTDKMFYL